MLSPERLQALLNEASIGYLERSEERITLVSRGILKLYNVSHSPGSLNELLEIVHLDDRAYVVDVIRRARTERSLFYEFRCRNRDGDRYLWHRGFVLPQGNSEVAYEIVTDSTLECQAEAKVLEWQTRLVFVAQDSQEKHLVINSKRMITEVILAAEFLGIPFWELKGKNLIELINFCESQDQQKLSQAIEQAQDKENITVEIACFDADRQVKYFEVACRLSQEASNQGDRSLVVMLRDVSERRQILNRLVEQEKQIAAQQAVVEAAQTQAEAVLHSILEAATDALLLVDAQSQIRNWNHQFIQLWNIPSTLLEERDHWRVIAFIQTQISNPGVLWEQVDQESLAVDESSCRITLKDGRIVERYSKPQVVHEQVVGRLTGYREINQGLRPVHSREDRERWAG